MSVPTRHTPARPHALSEFRVWNPNDSEDSFAHGWETENTTHAAAAPEFIDHEQEEDRTVPRQLRVAKIPYHDERLFNVTEVFREPEYTVEEITAPEQTAEEKC